MSDTDIPVIGLDCPECGARLRNKNGAVSCRMCAYVMPRDTEEEQPEKEKKPKYSCWTCQRCKKYTAGVAVIEGLCSSCRFEVVIKAKYSQASDLCDAPECEGTMPHKIERHIAEFRAHMARLNERIENWTKDQPLAGRPRR